MIKIEHMIIGLEVEGAGVVVEDMGIIGGTAEIILITITVAICKMVNKRLN
jgi:hypothetical protein